MYKYLQSPCTCIYKFCYMYLQPPCTCTYNLHVHVFTTSMYMYLQPPCTYTTSMYTYIQLPCTCTYNLVWLPMRSHNFVAMITESMYMLNPMYVCSIHSKANLRSG